MGGSIKVTATHTDNHLDVFEYLYKVELADDRKFIMPVSYGTGGNYGGNPDNLIAASRFKSGQALWLKETLPFVEYQQIINSVSHPVFGMLRQQALGNVHMCLRTGVKVYLFKNSIVYKELKKLGFVCFTIEDDLTTESLLTCLDEGDAVKNYKLYSEWVMSRSAIRCQDILKEAVANKQSLFRGV